MIRNITIIFLSLIFLFGCITPLPQATIKEWDERRTYVFDNISKEKLLKTAISVITESRKEVYKPHPRTRYEFSIKRLPDGFILRETSYQEVRFYNDFKFTVKEQGNDALALVEFFYSSSNIYEPLNVRDIDSANLLFSRINSKLRGSKWVSCEEAKKNRVQEGGLYIICI